MDAADSASRSASISITSTMSASATWRRGASAQTLRGLVDELQLWNFDGFLHCLDNRHLHKELRRQVPMTNIGMCGFCGQRRSDLDYLHHLPPGFTQRTSAVPKLSEVCHDESGFQGPQRFLHGLQAVESGLCPPQRAPVEPAQLAGRRTNGICLCATTGKSTILPMSCSCGTLTVF